MLTRDPFAVANRLVAVDYISRKFHLCGVVCLNGKSTYSLMWLGPLIYSISRFLRRLRFVVRLLYCIRKENTHNCGSTRCSKLLFCTSPIGVSDGVLSRDGEAQCIAAAHAIRGNSFSPCASMPDIEFFAM